MEERHLFGEYQRAPNHQSKPELESRLKRLQRVEQVVKEQSAFLVRQEAKARAAALQDARESRLLPIGTGNIVRM